MHVKNAAHTKNRIAQKAMRPEQQIGRTDQEQWEESTMNHAE